MQRVSHRTITAFIYCLSLLSAASPVQAQRPILMHSGTGFFVAPQYVVTNAHVVRGCNEVYIHGAVPGDTAQVVARDENLDLALISTQNASEEVTPLSQNYGQPIVGDRVYVVGYPGQEGARGIYRKVEAQVRGAVGGRDAFYITDVIRHGNSGGPVFDESGNVIGVAVAIRMLMTSTGQIIPNQSLGVVIGLGTLKDFLAHEGISIERGSYRVHQADYIEDQATSYIVNVLCPAADGTQG